jgi:hypothetical protein
LISLEYGRVHAFDASHNLFSVTYFTVQPLHFVIVVIALHVDVFDMDCSGDRFLV